MSKIYTYKEESVDGSFKRTESSFRDWIKADGSTAYQPEANRYHLYICYACPWAHRTLIVRKLKGLEHVISYSAVDWLMESQGWRFGHEGDEEPNFGENFTLLRQVYLSACPEYVGKITVPVLFDKKTKKIVNNESSEIIRMLNSEFNELAKNPSLDLYPEKLKSQIDGLNEWIYPTINNGVYRCGFATKQQPYNEAVKELFDALERVDNILDKSRYLTGDQLTEADVRLFTTLVRFDSVYHGHFKCNQKKLTEFKNIHDYTRDIYQTCGIGETVNMRHIKHHYYESHKNINPTGIVPVFTQTFDGDHGRNTK